LTAFAAPLEAETPLLGAMFLAPMGIVDQIVSYSGVAATPE